MLASNESCFAPLPEVVEAAQRVIGGVNRYPDPSYAPLRSALSERYEMAPERIALGSGSCDVLLAAGEALLEPGAEVVYAWPAFSVYPHLAAASGARAVEVPLAADDRHDLEAMVAEVTVATRLVLICNPNNPTSTALELDRVQELLDRVPRHVCVILDEAYVEFSLRIGDPFASLELLQTYPNLVLLRTFSKVYGLAGMRAGLRPVWVARLPHRRGSGAPAVLSGRPHPGRGGRGPAPSGPGGAPRQPDDRLPASLEEGVASARRRAAESDANFVWVHLPQDDGVPPRSMWLADWRRGGCWSAQALRSAGRAVSG